MTWDSYLILKVAGIVVFVFAGGLSASGNLSLSRAKTYFINAVAVLVGFACSRLWYIVQHYFGSEPYKIKDFLTTWNDSGAVLYGWVIGGTLALLFLTRFFKIPTVRYLDCVLPWLLVAQFLNRMGCFDAGCCYGKPTQFFFSVRSEIAQANVHPVQLYEAVYDLLLFWFIRTRPKRLGLPTFLYFIGYPSARFFLEFLRGDNQPAFLFLTVPQITSILLLALIWRLHSTGKLPVQ